MWVHDASRHSGFLHESLCEFSRNASMLIMSFFESVTGKPSDSDSPDQPSSARIDSGAFRPPVS